jgi:hypothetical protein
MKTGRKILLAVLVLFAVLILLQLIPVSRQNPPVVTDFKGDPGVRQILRRSCYDCHSNETVWPWYSRIAPVSWLVAGDVNEARGHLNFSEWGRMVTGDQNAMKRRIWKEIELDEMPPGRYLLMHSEARLTEHEKSLINTWAKGSSPTGSSSADAELPPE